MAFHLTAVFKQKVKLLCSYRGKIHKAQELPQHSDHAIKTAVSKCVSYSVCEVLGEKKKTYTYIYGLLTKTVIA